MLASIQAHQLLLQHQVQGAVIVRAITTVTAIAIVTAIIVVLTHRAIAVEAIHQVAMAVLIQERAIQAIRV